MCFTHFLVQCESSSVIYCLPSVALLRTCLFKQSDQHAYLYQVKQHGLSTNQKAVGVFNRCFILYLTRQQKMLS